VDRLLAPPETWKPVKAVFDLGSLVANSITASLHQAMPARIASQPSRAEALGDPVRGNREQQDGRGNQRARERS
jgi:hypothetical protein